MLAFLMVRALAFAMSVLPASVALTVASALGAFCFRAIRLRRKVVLANLAHVFGETHTEAERRAIAVDAYRQVAMLFVEVLRSTTSARRDLIASVEIEGLERFERLRAERTPLIFIQAHAGNFDLAAYSFAARGFEHHTVMRKIKNPRVHRMLVETREANGVIVHVKSERSMSELREALARGEWIGLLPDQNAKGRGVVVDWLGKPASIYAGPALLHLETTAQIVVVVSRRRASDRRRHDARMIMLPPHAPSGDREADVRAIMQAVADAAGAEIRKAPSQYFWFHRLWSQDWIAKREPAPRPGAGRRRRLSGPVGPPSYAPGRGAPTGERSNGGAHR